MCRRFLQKLTCGLLIRFSEGLVLALAFGRPRCPRSSSHDSL